MKQYYSYSVDVAQDHLETQSTDKGKNLKIQKDHAFARHISEQILVSLELSLDGKLFVEFVLLIFLSYIKKKMQDFELLKDYSIQGLLDELDIIGCYKETGKKIRFSEIKKRQASLYELLGVLIPGNSSL